jgi:hypothetical protein
MARQRFITVASASPRIRVTTSIALWADSRRATGDFALEIGHDLRPPLAEPFPVKSRVSRS